VLQIGESPLRLEEIAQNLPGSREVVVKIRFARFGGHNSTGVLTMSKE
jgi:hypothetical protein